MRYIINNSTPLHQQLRLISKPLFRAKRPKHLGSGTLATYVFHNLRRTAYFVGFNRGFGIGRDDYNNTCIGYRIDLRHTTVSGKGFEQIGQPSRTVIGPRMVSGRSDQLRVKKIVQFRTCELLRPPENPVDVVFNFSHSRQLLYT